MKKLLLVLILMLVPVFSVVSPTSAQFEPTEEACNEGELAGLPESEKPAACQGGQTEDPISGPGGVITDVVNVLSIVVGVAAVIMVFIGGLKMVLSGGDANRIKDGRETIIFALIGIAVTAMARSIIIFVINRI